MFWLAWIGWAVVFAVLFSVVKALDRLNHSVELIDARLDLLSGRLADVLAIVSAANTHARIERGISATDSLLEFAKDTSPASRVLATAEPRAAKERERSSGH